MCRYLYMIGIDMLSNEIDNGKWSDIPDEFVVIDTETTGLNPKKDRIIEIGAILFQKKDYISTGEVTTFQCFVKQDIEIPSEITKINGITNEMLITGDDELTALTKLFEFIDNRKILAYNSKFDKEFIEIAIIRSNLYGEKDSLIIEDILSIVKNTLYDLPNRKLKTVAKHINVKTDGAHRAVADCLMALHVYVHCMHIQYYVENSNKIQIVSKSAVVSDYSKINESETHPQSNNNLLDKATNYFWVVIAFVILILLIYSSKR